MKLLNGFPVLRLALSAASLSLLLFFAACEEEPNNQLCNTIAFNVDLFSQNVETALNNKVKGYSYVIMQNGQSVYAESDGDRTNATDGQADFLPDDRIHVASVSKFITTVATLHLIENNPDVSVNTPVAGYLPRDWTIGPGFENVTFLDLIAQQAGLNQFGTQNSRATRYDSLRAYVAAGAGQPKVKNYTNTHHALLRIILPRLWDKYRPNDGNYDDDFTGSVYEQCIQELLFEPLGINASCIAPNSSYALAYRSVTDTQAGSGAGLDYVNEAGGFGWFMSSLDVAKFWAYTWYTDDFIDDGSRAIMTANTAGLWNTTTGDKGTYFNKLGGWNLGTDAVRIEYNAIAMHYPNDVDLVIVTNSPHQDGTGLVALARDTYDDSFGCQ